MDPSTDVNSLYWRAYAGAVSKLLPPKSFNPSSNTLHIVPLSQYGIAGGPWIPDRITNWQLSGFADAMLDPQEPVYTPRGPGYFKHLTTYFNWAQPVPVSTEVTTGSAQVELEQARKNADTAQQSFQATSTEAQAAYAKAHSDAAFETWADANFPIWTQDRSRMEAAAARYLQVMRQVYGNDADSYYRDFQKLVRAGNTGLNESGLTMPCTAEDLDNVEALWAQAQGSTDPVPDGSLNQFFLPLYSISGYKGIVKGWVVSYKKQPPTEIKYNISEGRRLSWRDFGFQRASIDPHCPFQYPPESNLPKKPGSPEPDSRQLSQDDDNNAYAGWFCHIEPIPGEAHRGFSALPEEERFLDVAQSDEEDVRMTLTLGGFQLFSVECGEWDIPNFTEIYPLLSPQPPPALKQDLIKPVQLLLAYAVGLKATLSQTVYTNVQRMFNQAKDMHAIFSFGGYDFHPADHTARTGSEPVHYTYADFKMSTTNFDIDIPPSDTAYPVLLAVVGRHVPVNPAIN